MPMRMWLVDPKIMCRHHLSLYPDTEPWYDGIHGHIYTKIGNDWYNLNGRYKQIPKGSYLFTKEPRALAKAHRWKNNAPWIIKPGRGD